MTTTTQTLAAFILERVAEDEAAAKAATLGPWDHDEDEVWHPSPLGVSLTVVEGGTTEPNAAHIARHDPARVLAECEAKRRIVEAFMGSYGDALRAVPEFAYTGAWDFTLRALALPYRDHPDFDPAWA